MRILVIEDEEKMAEHLKRGLGQEGYVVDYRLNGTDGQEYIELNSDLLDLVILDLVLPGKDGIQVCKDIRQQDIAIPILMLTAKSDTEEKIIGLNAGADDYLTKPFSFGELLARVRALMRRPKPVSQVEIKFGPMVINTIVRKVAYHGREIKLTLREYSLLECLVRHPNQVLNREQILEKIWDTNFDSFSNVVDVHIKNIRRKLREVSHEEVLETVRGLGYRIKF